MKNVCVLGNGQLARMLKQAGEPLGIQVWPVGLEADPNSIPIHDSVITAEIERWPETPLTRQLASHSAFVNRAIFPRLADRYSQKALLDELNLPTSPWLLLRNNEQWPSIFETLGNSVLVKRRTGGYDGRGQWHVNSRTPQNLPETCYNHSIVERTINFSGEVSLIAARKADGTLVFYPLTHNHHQNGILYASFVDPNFDNDLQRKAQEMLSAIMHSLNYVGVMAMECFITEVGLLINELAPRVHNSGHWTQNGASLSQFELHLRAINNLPLPEPTVSRPSVMINLIDCEYNPQWLAHSLVNLHWYDKKRREHRKMGHLNLSDRNPAALAQTLNALSSQFPLHYQSAITWLLAKLDPDLSNRVLG